jgi:plastin-1
MPHGFAADKVKEFQAAFDQWNTNSDDKLDAHELTVALQELGDWDTKRLAKILQEVDVNRDGAIDFDEFLDALWKLKQSGNASAFGQFVDKTVTLVTIGGHQTGVQHSFSREEVSAFASHLNYVLGDDPDLDYLMPINPDNDDLFVKAKDGVLIAKFINQIEPDTIDWRAVNFKKGGGLNQFKIIENQNLNINAAKALGLRISNLGAEDLRDADQYPTLVLGFMWQAVKMQLLGNINLKAHPELIRLLKDGETLEDLLALPPEQLLIRWVNYHMEKQGYDRRINGFGQKNIGDANVYTVLLQSIGDDKCTRAPLNDPLDKRAQTVLDNATRIGANVFIRPNDITEGNEKLNLAFTAQLFNTAPGLEALDENEQKEFDLAGLMDDDTGDSREERAFRMWINSLNINTNGFDDTLYLNDLFADSRNGLALLRLIDNITATPPSQRGVVDWKKVEKKPKIVFKKRINGDYACLLAKAPPIKASLQATGGMDIEQANKKLVLGLVWQLMRFHLLKFLSELTRGGKQMTEDDILEWCNTTVQSTGKNKSITSFADASLASGVYWLDLLTAVQPEIVDAQYVTDGVTEDDQLLNAKYAISLARKLGAVVFCVPEDLAEVRKKMCLVFAGAIMKFGLSKGPNRPLPS